MDLLAFDTFSEVCSVAWLESGAKAQTSVLKTTEPRSHASKLAIFASELIEGKARNPKGIVLIAGPGSYTGLRIGASTAKGLAWSLDIPLYAVSTLHYLGMCAVGLKEGEMVTVATSSRADEVFAAHFSVLDGLLARSTPDSPMALDVFKASFEELKSTNTFISTEANLCDEVSNVSHATCLMVEPDLTCLIPYLANQLENFRVEDLNSFEPAYLKDFVARKAAKSIFEKLQF